MSVDIERLVSEGRKALSEPEAAEFLSGFGIPFPPQIRAASANEAAEAAESIGYPVVVKGAGSKMLHKSELGAVMLDIRSKQEVLHACSKIEASAKDLLEGFWVQKFIPAKREFVAGLIRDIQFGPSVMFGLGGIFTEVLKEVSFRIAPVSKRDAIELINETAAGKLASGVRGLAPANMDSLVKIISALGEIGLNYPQIAEIDLNPVRISDDGEVFVVDALVTLNKKEQ